MSCEVRMVLVWLAVAFILGVVLGLIGDQNVFNW